MVTAWACENLLREVHEDAGPQLGGQPLRGLRLGPVGRRQPALDRLTVFPAAGRGQGRRGSGHTPIVTAVGDMQLSWHVWRGVGWGMGGTSLKVTCPDMLAPLQLQA